MASHPESSTHGQSEHCPTCGRETVHAVDIEIRTESDRDDRAEFSREPYRVATCTACGRESAKRMNNA